MSLSELGLICKRLISEYENYTIKKNNNICIVWIID